MEKGVDYRITKLESGPLQRFKNQNLLVKRFGEVALQIYRNITGKRSSEELKKDISIEDKMFYPILSFMEENAMITLEAIGSGAETEAEDKEPETETKEETEPEEEEKEDTFEIEPLTPEEPPKVELPKEKQRERKKDSAHPAEDEITPIELQDANEYDKEDNEEQQKDQDEEDKAEDEKKKGGKRTGRDYGTRAGRQESISPQEDIELDLASPAAPEDEGLSPVEKIIKDRYGDVGLQVYDLIDGQRTAEQIMRSTGLTESKLVEILDFLDAEGIIKLDYPKGQPPPRTAMTTGARGSGFTSGPQMPPASQQRQEKKPAAFVPMIESEEALEGAKGVPSPVEIPLKAALDIVKSVQMKAKVLIKYGDKGGKLNDEINGKNDVIDIALKLDMPLYKVIEILYFMLENGFILMKPLTRTEVRKKYGDDGYAVYKRYGKEGLMLYELIGKNMTIKQMAEKVTTEHATIIDMFIFIHQVLGIELPIDREVLKKQLGL